MVRTLSNLLSLAPINPVVILWTSGAFAALIFTLWLCALAYFDRDAVKLYDGTERHDIMYRIANINWRNAVGNLLMASAFFIVGISAIIVSPARFPTNPAALIKSLIQLCAFLAAEWYLISSSFTNLRDRFWLLNALKESKLLKATSKATTKTHDS